MSSPCFFHVVASISEVSRLVRVRVRVRVMGTGYKGSGSGSG